MSIPNPILDKIRAHAQASLQGSRDLSVDAVHLHLHRPGVGIGHRLVLGLGRSHTIARPTVIVLADQKPHANWGHPCEHQLYDSSTGDHYETVRSSLPPEAWFSAPNEFEGFHEPVPAPAPEMADVPRAIPQLSAALANTKGNRHAILFAGMSNNRHLNDLEFLYRTLIDLYKFDAANITVLNWDGTVNYSGDPQPANTWPGDGTAYRIKVNASGTRDALLGAIGAVKAKLGGGDLLFIHTNNHGGGEPDDPEAWLCCYPNWASCTATEFGAALAQLPPFNTLFVMMEQCHSGGFKDPVINNSTAAYTSFAAACAFDKSSAGGSNFDPFARDWIAAVTGHGANGAALESAVPVPASAAEAYAYARSVKVDMDTPVYAEKPKGAGGSMHLTGPLAVPFASATAAVNSDGRIELFLRATDGGVWSIAQTGASRASWTAPNSLGGSGSRPLSAALNTDGRLEIFGIGADGAVWHNWQTKPHSGPWSGWSRIGGVVRQLAASVNTDGRIEVVGVGTDGAAWHACQLLPHCKPWSPWLSIGGKVSELTSVINTDGRMEVFGIGSEGALWHIGQTLPHSLPWSAWASLGGRVKHIAAVVNRDGRAEIFGIGTDDALWHTAQASAHGSKWSTWASVGGKVSQILPIRHKDGHLEVFAVAPDSTLWHLVQAAANTNKWGTWTSLGGSVKQITGALNADGRTQVFGVGADAHLRTITELDATSGQWSAWSTIV